MPTATLALDYGAHLGWALERPDGRIETGCKLLSDGGRVGEKFYQFRLWLHDTKRRCAGLGGDIGLLIYERVDFAVPGQVYASHAWGGYEATATAWCEHHGIEYQGVAVSSLKKRATGNHHSPKPHVRDAVNQRLLALQPGARRIVDLNESDAAALLLFAREPQRRAA